MAVELVVFMLRHYEKMSAAEIAERTSLTHRQVNYYLKKAEKILPIKKQPNLHDMRVPIYSIEH